VNIRQKFIGLLLFIGLLPTLIVGVISYVTTSRELTNRTSDQLTSIAVKQQQKVNGLVQNKQEEVTKLANKYDFQLALGQYLKSKDKTGVDILDQILQAKKTEVPDIKDIYVTNLDGTVISSTVADATNKKLSSNYAVAASQETSTTVREDSRDGFNKLYITTGVSLGKVDSAVLNVSFRIDDIVAAIQDYTGLGVTGETVIGQKNDKGDVVSLFPLRFNTDAALDTKLNGLDLFRTVSQDQQGGNPVDYRSQPVMLSRQTINAADWAIATKIDAKEAFAPIVKLRNTMVVIVVATSAALLLIAFYLTRYFTKPILDMAQASQLIGAGNFTTRVDIRRKDELGILGDRINAMGASLNDIVSSIETQRNRLEIILNSTAESILAIDKQGSIIIANHATTELTGRSLPDIIGKHINDIFIWSQEMQPFTIDYSKIGTNTYTDLQYNDANGSQHFVKLIIAHITDAQEQKAAQTIITIHDETKSREFESMKVDFVSMAAHELRTPLAAIRGYLELVTYKDAEKFAPESTKYLNQALKSTSELGSLITNLLDVTRIERGTLTFNMEKVDLATDIKQAVQDVSFTAKDKNITTTYVGPEQGYSIIADKIAIHEVINNLLTNAIKYTPAGGSVSITLTQDDNTFVARFKDSGIGIPKQAMSHLFTKFYRVHGGLSSGSTGTGLGLFISRSIIERHGGSISVESEEGIGSTFIVKLPVMNSAQFEAIETARASQENITRRHRGWVTKNIAR
jgi:PAS domain S-box-containing protein